MDWLKKIIEKAEIKDNKLDIENLMKEINKEFPKNAMPKEEYNNVKEQLKTANNTLKSLEGNMSKEDIETLKKTHKEEIKKLEEKYKDEMYQKDKNYALDKELTSSNCRDINDIKALLKMEDITYKDGKINGLEGQIESLKKTKSYLFNEEAKKEENPTYQLVDYNPVSGEGADTLTAQIASAINGTI
ncbi:phage scaffolding protein [Clostridium perfringens]|nr:phage scaffolding protein [Clostridium perfringens]